MTFGRRCGWQCLWSMAAVDMPMLCVTGSLDPHVDIGLAPRRVRAGVPLENRLAVYRGLPPSRRMLAFVHGADHMSLSGSPVDDRFFGRASGWDPTQGPAHDAAVVNCTSVFLQRVRAGSGAGWAAGRVEFPGGYLVSGPDS